MKLDRAFLDAFAAHGGGEPPAQKLALTIRPSFVAAKGYTYVWGDWSNIEARGLPWLADSPGAEAKLDIFRDVDRNPELPDVYMCTAADMLRKPPEEVTKPERQSHGKVPELSLGFGGGVGALQNMAANYKVYLDDKLAAEVVQKWRDANRWAVAFWGYHGRDGSAGLWGAANSAVENPETIVPAGRVAYVYDPTYLKGTLFCALPCGRLLTYPNIKWEWREVEDKNTGEKHDRYQLTYIKGYGRAALWHGKLAENVTQATCASILRRTLKRLARMRNMDVVMHSHDEIVLEEPEGLADMAGQMLRETMTTNDPWDAGLPLAADIKSGWYYTKSGD